MSFRITETDAEIEARIEKWDKYLEEDEEKEKKKQETSSSEKQKMSQWECIVSIMIDRIVFYRFYFLYFSKSPHCRIAFEC